MLHYLLQILIFQLLFLVIYDLFHKKETFFNWNRLYLIITPFLSLVLPFIKLETFRVSSSQVFITKIERVITVSSESLQVLGTTGPEQSPTNWWLILYCIGAGISFFLLILRFYKLAILKTISLRSILGTKKIIILPNSNQAFSFWNTVYIGDAIKENEKKQILIHELVHVQHKHSLDQLYFEILKIVLWWNPLIYSYQSKITILHEYIADAAVISTVNKKNYIDQLLNAAFQTQEITFVNQFFNQSLIKKRILMLQKTKSKTISKFKYLLLIPVITSILVYTSCSDDSSQSETNSKNGTTEKSATENKVETACLNHNSIYDKSLNNYLKIEVGKYTDVIVSVINIDTEKSVRTAYIKRTQAYYLRNIPEGQYRIDIIYGEDYTEETLNGVCTGFFKKQKLTESPENFLDFNTVTTSKGKNVPSYSLSLDLTDPASYGYPQDDKNNMTEGGDSLSVCLKQNAVYDTALDNYIQLEIADNTEIIADLISIEDLKSVRTIHLKENTKSFIRNIPEGKYQLKIQYGERYEEVTVNGTCSARFKNQMKSEIAKGILDFTITKSEGNRNVPSYSMTIDILDKN